MCGDGRPVLSSPPPIPLPSTGDTPLTAAPGDESTKWSSSSSKFVRRYFCPDICTHMPQQMSSYQLYMYHASALGHRTFQRFYIRMHYKLSNINYIKSRSWYFGLISNIVGSINEVNRRQIRLYRVVQKTAQSLWHHNFATVHHSHAVFSKMFWKKFFTWLKSVFEYSN